VRQRSPASLSTLPGAILVLAALAWLVAPWPSSSQAQTFDIEGHLIPRNPMRAASDTLLAITVHRLAPGVYAAKNRFVWNGWVELPDGILVIDGGYDARSAKALADTIQARSGPKPFRFLVLTSTQVDHIGGVRTFAGLGATVIVQANVAKAVRDSLPAGLGGAPPGSAERAAPNRAHGRARAAKEPPLRKPLLEVKNRLVLGTKASPVVIEWAGRPACTGGDLSVYLAKQRVLFTGDLAWYHSIPWLVDPAFSRLGWIATLDTLLTKRFDVDSLVPGHGVIATKLDGVMFTRRYLTGAWELASQQAGWGVPVDNVDQWGDLGAFEDMEFYDPVHFMNMRRLYLESKGIKTPGRRRPGVIMPKRP
jgi:glyoxylase-like metal-dependent hydrolase (beta-lactamase superfamily II)